MTTIAARPHLVQSAVSRSTSSRALSSRAGRKRGDRPAAVAAQGRPVASRRSAAPALRITRRGRLLLTLLVFLLALAVAGIVVSGLDAPEAIAGSSAPTSRSVTVAPGDTLWDYAAEYAPEGTDPRDYVLLVERENNLGSERLVAGTTIVLPDPESAQR